MMATTSGPSAAATRTAVALLPGLLCDGTVWAHQADALGRDHDVHIADFRNFRSITDMARSILESMPDRFSVAGHSMGARVAIEVARIAPGRVARLALLDTGTHPVAPGEPAKRQVLIDMANAHGMQALVDAWLPPMVHPGRLDDEALMEPLRAMVLRMSPAIYGNQIAALLGRPDAASVLPHLRMPVLIGVGRQDGWSPPAQHEAMVALVPHAGYVVFEESGHMAPAEAPEAVTAALVRWMHMPAG